MCQEGSPNNVPTIEIAGGPPRHSRHFIHFVGWCDGFFLSFFVRDFLFLVTNPQETIAAEKAMAVLPPNKMAILLRHSYHKPLPQQDP